MDSERIRGVTLRVAIFFGLTTFTLCIAIFYIESILDNTRDTVIQKDSIIQVLEQDLEYQQSQLKDAEMKILDLTSQINSSNEASETDIEPE